MRYKICTEKLNYGYKCTLVDTSTFKDIIVVMAPMSKNVKQYLI